MTRDEIKHGFTLTCSCGEEQDGIILPGTKYDRIHCPCGLVWTINVPEGGETP